MKYRSLEKNKSNREPDYFKKFDYQMAENPKHIPFNISVIYLTNKLTELIPMIYIDSII